MFKINIAYRRFASSKISYFLRIKFHWYMFYLLHFNVILFYLGEGSFTFLSSGVYFPIYFCLFVWAILQNSHIKTLSLPITGQRVHIAVRILSMRCYLLKMSLPLMCLKITWLMHAVSVAQLFTFELSVCSKELT